VLRTALQPRWLALLGAVVVIAVAFTWLGSWQLGVARDRGAEKARREIAARPPIALDQVLQPQQPFPTAGDGRAVVAHGTYDPARQVLVAHRLQHGRDGWWVVAALRTDAGGWLPAVRGWVASPDDVLA
jgi:cytochrome oxidase assembly protein ShyY1